MRTASVIAKSEAQPVSRLRDCLELAKPEVTSLIIIATLAGFYLGSHGEMNLLLLFHTLLGTALVAGGTGALNQFVERDTDALMRRTAQRPLPAGRMHPGMGLAYGSGLAALGTAYLLLLVNPLASLLAVLTLASYLLLYTPLKSRTHLCTLVGAFPGAMPPLIGWAAAQNQLAPEAWALYGILFFWQFPHFFAIAWLYRDDYARGGIIMLPAVDPSGRATFRQIVAYSALLLPVSVLPSLLGLAGTLYLWSAVLLGVAFLAVSVWGALSRTAVRARILLHASVLYLPALLGLLMFDKQVH